MRRRWIHFIAVFLFFAGGSPFADEGADLRARILKVNRTATSGSPHETSRLRMPKFLDRELPAMGDEYQVTWEPVSGISLADATVSFEYAQQRVAGTQILSVQYPFAVTSRRVATFTIAERAYKLGGPVSRWRVRVRRGEQILAETASPNWRAAL